jgi:hypothetical protein
MPLREGARPAGRAGAVGGVLVVGGQRYEIGGVGWGALPAWRFISKDGGPFTAQQFDALPLSDKEELAWHVQAHINSLGGSAAGGRLISSPLRAGPLGGTSSALTSSLFNTSAFNASPNTSARQNDDSSPYPTGYNEGPDEHRDAAGNALTDAEVADLNGVGFPILDSGRGGTVASGSMGGSSRVSPMEGLATVTGSGPPPDIPEPGPAMIEPVWVDGRLGLLKGLPANDMADDGVVSLIAAVRSGFEGFIRTLSASGTNLHPALRGYIEGVPDLLVGVPDQVRVFEMGHAVEHLEAQQDVIEDELGGALANRYRVLMVQFRRCVEKFPCWRELVSGANADPLPADQAEQAVPTARALAAALATDEAGAVVDPSVAEALTDLADAAAEATTAAERSLFDFDLMSSISRIMTALYQPVIYCWHEIGNGAWSALKKLPSKVGSGAVEWGGGTLLAIAALHLGAAPLAASVETLAAHYPTLTWLMAVESFLKFLATLPKG